MKRMAAFLDRDGVINKENGLIYKKEQFQIMPQVAQAIRKLNELGYLVIVVTNQAVIARGYLCDEHFVIELHKHMVESLRKEGAIIDAVYYCPHHPDADDRKYRKECNCRKPNTGMIDKAVRDFGIDLKESFVIGDMSGDIQLGKNAGCKTILITGGHGGKDGKYDAKADYEAENLSEAVKIIDSQFMGNQ